MKIKINPQKWLKKDRLVQDAFFKEDVYSYIGKYFPQLIKTRIYASQTSTQLLTYITKNYSRKKRQKEKL